MNCSLVLGFPLLLLVALEQNDWNDEDQQQDDGHGGGHGPVTVVEEFFPEDLADHQGLRTAQERRDNELAQRRDEDKETARDDACFAKRDSHQPEGGCARAAEVFRGFEQAVVHLFQR